MTMGIASTPLRPPLREPPSDASHAPASAKSAGRTSPASRRVLLEARHLRKRYKTQFAVEDVSFSLQGGEVLGLLGPNGAGKSTSMLMLAGLLTPTSGEVFLNGQKFDGRNPEQRRLFGIVPQEYAIYEQLSAVDNLIFFGRLYDLRGALLRARCAEVLEHIGLTKSAHRPAGTYSGGMKRRLNFGIALMHQPAILILDEPTLGVDPESRLRLIDCIHRHTVDGGCVLYASHNMEEAQSICQRVVILDHGRVIANDTIQHLLAGHAADIYLSVDRTAGIGDELKALARVGIGSNQEPAVIVSGNTPDAPESINEQRSTGDRATAAAGAASLAASLAERLQATLGKLKTLGIQVLRVETRQSNLEHIFLRLTGNQPRQAGSLQEDSHSSTSPAEDA
jgi:ABC-2 type transport system ATP-binding protein